MFLLGNEGFFHLEKGGFAIQPDRGNWHRDDQGNILKRWKKSSSKISSIFSGFFLAHGFFGQGSHGSFGQNPLR